MGSYFFRKIYTPYIEEYWADNWIINTEVYYEDLYNNY